MFLISTTEAVLIITQTTPEALAALAAVWADQSIRHISGDTLAIQWNPTITYSHAHPTLVSFPDPPPKRKRRVWRL